MRRVWIVTGVAAAMVVTTGAAGASARVHPAGRGGVAGTFAGPAYTPAFGINDQGVIVGAFIRHGHRYGFLLRDGVYTTLSVPDSTDTFANGITTAGAVVGGYTDEAGHLHGYLLSDGTYRPVDDPKGTLGTRVHAINAAGDIVGAYVDRSGIHGFLLHDGTYTTINVP